MTDLHAAVLRCSNEPIFVTNREGRIVYVNPAAERTARRSAADLLGKTWADLGFPTGVLEQVAARRAEIISESKAIRERIEAPTEVVGIRYIEFSSAPWRADDGSVQGVVTLVRDGGPEVALEQERDATVRLLQEAVEARDRVMGILSHDLKQPLLACGLNLGMMRRMLTGGQAPAKSLLELVESANESLRSMTSMIDDLLDVTRIHSGALRVECRAEEVCSLLEDAEQAFRWIALEKGIQLESKVSDPGVLVHCDRRRIRQVFGNLIGNALRYTGAGGRVELSVHEDGDTVVFHVRDTGIGIGADQLPRIFDRFWRGRGATPSDGGAGLGLSIAQGIVEAHQGRIWADSQPGQGSCFHFSLRRHHEPLQHATQSS